MGLKKFSSEVIKEGRRVRWPKRDVLITSVLTVLIIAIFAGLILWLEDYAGNTLIEIIKDAFAGMGK